MGSEGNVRNSNQTKITDMEKINNLIEKFTNYMNNIPVEKRKNIVIIVCAIIGLLFVLKCVLSIALTEKPEQTISEKITEVATGIKEEYNESSQKKNDMKSQKDSFIQMLEEIDSQKQSDSIK